MAAALTAVTAAACALYASALLRKKRSAGIQ